MFNLRTDLSEQKDLSQQMPGKTHQLHGALTEYLDRVNAVTPKDEELSIDRIRPLMKKAVAQKEGKK